MPSETHTTSARSPVDDPASACSAATAWARSAVMGRTIEQRYVPGAGDRRQLGRVHRLRQRHGGGAQLLAASRSARGARAAARRQPRGRGGPSARSSPNTALARAPARNRSCGSRSRLPARATSGQCSARPAPAQPVRPGERRLDRHAGTVAGRGDKDGEVAGVPAPQGFQQLGRRRRVQLARPRRAGRCGSHRPRSDQLVQRTTGPAQVEDDLAHRAALQRARPAARRAARRPRRPAGSCRTAPGP